MTKKSKIIIGIITCIIVLRCVGFQDTEKKQIENENTTNLEEKKTKDNEYVSDDVVNSFIKEFKESSTFEMKDINRGNIKTKFFVNINGQRCELLNATDNVTKAFYITIYGGNKKEDINKIINVYSEVIKTLNPLIGIDELKNSIDNIKSSQYMTSLKIGDNEVIYYPITHLSKYDTDCRIEIATTKYNK